jgi:diguanylate cyclase (GGDEF)-like protein
VDRLASERRPDRIAAAALDAALAATGARAGRLIGPCGSRRQGQLALEGQPVADLPPMAAELPGAAGPLGRIEVWGVADDPGAEAALRVVAAVCARALDAIMLERDRSEDRRRARRLAVAAAAVREAGEPREAVARALAEARALVGAPAAAMVARGEPHLEVGAYDGLEPLDEGELSALVPAELRPRLAEGQGWCGTLPDDSPLRARGFASAALVAVGARASLGFLAVLDGAEEPLAPEHLADLVEFAGHAAGALTTSVLRQEVRDLGAVDPLTRFFNARYFHGRLDQECQRSLRAGAPVSVALMTLDGLAELRAEGRASAADAAVEAFASHVAARLRAMDVGCRVADDELAVILPEVEGIDALRVGERLRASLRHDPVLGGTFSLSVGVASFPDQAGTAQSLVVNARSALEWAGRHGGDRTFLYHADTAEILRAQERADGAGDETLLTTVAALAAAIDARHPSTVHHSENVGRVAALIAAEVGLAPDRVEDVRVAGMLHDVGKIGVREDIVIKPEPLSDAEREELRRHPEIGERMLSGSRLAPLRPWVLHHHERMDGRGYPAGLAGEAIPLEARILAVANAFDRLLSGGPARFPLPVADVMDELERRSGRELDPAAVAALRALVGRGAADVPSSAT